MIKHFRCFYPKPSFVPLAPLGQKDLTKMKEVVWEHDDRDFELRIRRDGMIMIHVPALDDKISREMPNTIPIPEPNLNIGLWNRCLDILNTTYLLLDSATLEAMEPPHSIFSLRELDFDVVMHATYKDQCYQSSSIDYHNEHPSNKLHGLISSVVPEPVFAHLAQQLKHAFELDLFKTLGVFAKAISEHKIGNYDVALVLAWFGIETKINEIWVSYLDSSQHEHADGEKRISRKRRELLLGRDYSMSVVTNFLELAELLPFEHFKRVNDVRRIRNLVVHRTGSCDIAQSEMAIRFGLELVLGKTSLSVTPNLSLTVPHLPA